MKIRYFIIGLAIIVMGFAAIQLLRENPKTVFERLVEKPIPKSVQFIRQGRFVAMDSKLLVLHFRISKSDLEALLKNQHFSPIDEGKEFKRWDQNTMNYVRIPKTEYLELWKHRISEATNLDIDLTNTWQIYILNEGVGEKLIFAALDGTDVVFVADAH